MFFRKPQKMRNGLIILLGALGIGLITPDGVKDGPHGVPSGSTFTLEVNSIAQILIANTFEDIANTEFQVQGDDGAYSTDNPEGLKKHFGEFGLTVNDEKSYISKKGEIMKKLILSIAALALFATSAFAERYVMITHGEGKDPFWPVVQKGGEDAARAIGADFEYIYNPSADMADMASSIQAAAATQPDGMVISLPDPDALGPAIKAAVAAGVPVITMNSGLESSASLGALMHVGQPELLAGQKAGERAKAEGASKALCMIQEAYNTALVDRCEGYGSAVPMQMTDTTSDPATIQTRATAALQANSDIDAILSVGPHVCEAVDKALADLGMTVHHSCFDLSPAVMDLIGSGRVAFTIDQQQRLQGYMPIIVLHLYNNSAGLLPGANIPSGPGFVDKSNASSVAALAGIDR
jgi:simple sugar transport system substrate-binding protein